MRKCVLEIVCADPGIVFMAIDVIARDKCGASFRQVDQALQHHRKAGRITWAHSAWWPEPSAFENEQ